MGKKVVVIGAVALGPKAACRLRRLDPEAEIVMIDRDSYISYGGCGIPYYVSGEVQDLTGLRETTFHVTRDPEFFKNYKYLDVRARTEALRLDRRAKVVRVKSLDSGEEYDLPYDVCILATGSRPFVPPVPGADLPGVYPMANLHHAEAVKEAVAKGKVERAVIIGGGAIGLEMAEAMADLWGVETTIVELQKGLLPQALGPELSAMAVQELEKNGVRVLTGEQVTAIEGGPDGVTGVVTAGAGRIACDLVIMAVGARPNVDLAREAGLAIGRFGGIVVDARMCTSDPNIFAGGDCVEVRNLVSGGSAFLPLGSLANRQGRVIGTNAAGGHEEFPGVVGTFCLKIFELGLARAGLTETQAAAAGFTPVSSLVAMADRAHFYPTQQLMYVKLIADASSRRLLGIEAGGRNGDAVKARVDAVVHMLASGGSLDEVSTLEVGYAPPFASAMDIVNAAGNALANILDGLDEPLPMDEFLRLFKEGKLTVLDIRAPSSAEAYQKKWGDRWLNIPQELLPESLDKVPDDRPLAVFCNSGMRAYECLRFLKSKGRENLVNPKGGHAFLQLLDPEFNTPEGGDKKE
jgi:NADPH-dependent 2,4-dienoyl-CoA reductase/sulfur reductase-like enzyme/rhodanese-related sulfurtransferase